MVCWGDSVWIYFWFWRCNKMPHNPTNLMTVHRAFCKFNLVQAERPAPSEKQPPTLLRLCRENWPWNSWKTNRAPHNIFYSGAIHSARPTKIIISPTLPFTTNRESEFIIGPPSSFTSLITHFHLLFAPFFIPSISNFMAFYMSRKWHDLSPKFQTVIVC